jgi:hypothetical protein
MPFALAVNIVNNDPKVLQGSRRKTVETIEKIKSDLIGKGEKKYFITIA